MRTESRSISIAAAPEAVFAYVADPRNLPAWAPAFATAVRPDGDAWLVQQGDAELRIAVRACAEHGTVDLVAAQDARLGAFTRVVPSPQGSAYVFTLHFDDDVPEDAVSGQMATVEEELRAVRAAVG
jgi:uncharacterized protein YndB with AHSA1/START domain